MDIQQQFNEWANYLDQHKYNVPCGMVCDGRYHSAIETAIINNQRSTNAFNTSIKIEITNKVHWQQTGIYAIIFYDQALYDAFCDRYITSNQDNYTWNQWVCDTFASFENPDRAAIKIVGCSQEYTAADLLTLEFGYYNTGALCPSN